MAAASSSVFLITIPLVLKGQHLHGNDLETSQILKCQKEHNRYTTNGFSVAAVDTNNGICGRIPVQFNECFIDLIDNHAALIEW